MSNHGIRASRLPDLPTAGYSSEREKATSDLVMFWLRNVERDRVLLLSIVVDGPEKWRQTAGKAWDLNRAGRSTAVTTDLLNAVFQYMALLAGPNPSQQLLILLSQLKQQDRERWDKRQSTKVQARKALSTALDDLQRYGTTHRRGD